MEHTSNEQGQLAAVQQRIEDLRVHLSEHPGPQADAPVHEWFAFLASIKAIVGNASNDASLLACLMAKHWLCRELPMQPFDVAFKPQGAPGLDIDAKTIDGERVVGEIKTTTPYHGHDLGAAQKLTFVKDFRKLEEAVAVHKFFFVTDEATFDVVQRRYLDQLPGSTVVLLEGRDESNTA
jgi:hypothetical protein